MDETIIKWLELNTLTRTEGAMPDHTHSDDTYNFIGANGTVCAIHPSIEEVERPGSKNHTYIWRLTIRYQPPERGFTFRINESANRNGF